MATDDEFFTHLDSLGEEEVRRQIAQGQHGTPGSQLRSRVELWLRLKKESRELASSSRKESREEMSLSISRKALFNSRCATIIAMIAMIVAASDKVIVFLHWLGVLKP
jgi:hypothetical protein